MKLTIIAAVLLLAVAWPYFGECLEINWSGAITPDLICTSVETQVQMSFTNSSQAPNGYTLWSADALDFWIFRRFQDGVRDTIGIHIPSGRSILIPAPPSILENGTWTQTIFIGGQTDTVYAMPWYR